MMSLFFSREGKRIVCGGTTSKLAADHLQKELKTHIKYIDREIPPTAEIEGVDLVTEGIITMNRVLQNAERYLSAGENSWLDKEDGASLASELLFKEATDIFFVVGTAINPAHQNPDLPGNHSLKTRIVENLATFLQKNGKEGQNHLLLMFLCKKKTIGR